MAFKMKLGVWTPLSYDSEDGFYSATTNMLDVAAQNLKTLFLTNPGERTYHPNFGIGVAQYIFEMDTQSLRTSMATRISEQVSRYLPYVEIINILYGSEPDKHILSVTVEYAVVTGASVSEKQEVGFEGKDGSVVTSASRGGKDANASRARPSSI
tara:strand:- start:233 stop:697 length:465 start_codon:yes stop_codon:yes gene_type:complete